MQALLMVIIIPLMLLNLFGGIVSGIWLGILGEWWAIVYGIVGIVLSPFLLGIAMMPGLLFIYPASKLVEKGKAGLSFPLVLLSQIYTYAIITAWCLFVFHFFISSASKDTFWPLLIWSYGVALGPLMYMAQKEEQGGTGDASVMTAFFAQVAYVVVVLFAGIGGTPFLNLVIIFSGVIMVGILIHASLAFTMLREGKGGGI